MSQLINKENLKNDLMRFYPSECLAGISAETLFKQILHDIDNAAAIEQPDIVFLCDKQIECGMSGDCGIMCKHTHNIQHAVNFECIENTNGNVYYFEKERGNT